MFQYTEGIQVHVQLNKHDLEIHFFLPNHFAVLSNMPNTKKYLTLSENLKV